LRYHESYEQIMIIKCVKFPNGKLLKPIIRSNINAVMCGASSEDTRVSFFKGIRGLNFKDSKEQEKCQKL